MSISDYADDVVRFIERLDPSALLDRTVKLGVTGLSGAGKTVFVTSLVQNLLRRGRLPLLEGVADGRVEAVILRPQPDPGVARFAFERHLEALTGANPAWPEGTSRISQLRLSIRYRPRSWLRRQIQSTATLNLDIVDYPGEWLLDLPLLRLNYAAWSARTLTLCEREPRRALSAAWREHLKGLDPAQPADEATAQRTAALFTDFLRAARSDAAHLSELPPGRFLLPGEMEGSPALTFSPLPVGAGRPPRGSLHELMEERYRAYLDVAVKPFYRKHFARLDRQIVLVDVLGTLNAGRTAWADLQNALTDIMESFRPGPDSWLRGLLGGRITRILFAATKADLLHHTEHDRLEKLLKSMLDRAIDRAVFEGAAVSAVALAGLRTTTETTVREGGEALACVEGVREGTGERQVVFPGKLPEDVDSVFVREDADPERYGFVAFAPPPGLDSTRGLPHIRLDRALQYLIGDALG